MSVIIRVNPCLNLISAFFRVFRVLNPFRKNWPPGLIRIFERTNHPHRWETQVSLLAN